MGNRDPRLKELIDEQGFLYRRLNERFLLKYRALVLSLLEEVLPFMPMFLRYFTDHGANHSSQIIRIMDELVPSLTPPINRSEAFLLLASAWLHDVGILRNVDPDTGLLLEDKEIRRRHGELSGETVMKFAEELHLKDHRYKNLPHCVAGMCSYHQRCKKVDELGDQWVGRDNVRLALLASILRVADALDVRKTRAPWLIRQIMILPSESLVHWQSYDAVNEGMPILIDNGDTEKGIPGMKTIRIIGTGKTRDKIGFEYRMRDIFEEIEEVKQMLAKADLRIKDVEFIYQDLGQTESVSQHVSHVSIDLGKSKEYYLRRALEATWHLEYAKLPTKNVRVGLDYCLSAADQARDAEDNDHELLWRSKASGHFQNLEGCSPLAGFLGVRKHENESRLKILKGFDLNDLETVFMEDMELIRRGIAYLSSVYPRDIAAGAYGTLILLRYGFTPLRSEIREAIAQVLSHHIVQKGTEAYVHNECNLCSGRILSVLAFTRQFGDFFNETATDEHIAGIMSWLDSQEEYAWGTIGRAPEVVKSPRYAASVLEGLMDSFVSCQEHKSMEHMLRLIHQVAETSMEMNTWERPVLFEERASYVFAHLLRSLYCYSISFPERRVFEGLDTEFWRGVSPDPESDCLLDQIEGWMCTVFWNSWKNEELRWQKQTIARLIREKVRASAIWRKEDGSWGSNRANTRRILDAWLTYWQYRWAVEEATTK